MVTQHFPDPYGLTDHIDITFTGQTDPILLETEQRLTKTIPENDIQQKRRLSWMNCDTKFWNHSLRRADVKFAGIGQKLPIAVKKRNVIIIGVRLDEGNRFYTSNTKPGRAENPNVFSKSN